MPIFLHIEGDDMANSVFSDLLRNRIKGSVVLLALGAAVLGANAKSEDVKSENFNVLGTWSALNNYSAYEVPLWEEYLPEASENQISGTIVSMSEMGLSGFETMRLLKSGIFDFVHLTMGYATGDEPAMEGLDLASVSQDIDMARDIVDAYMPVINQRLAANHNLKILSAYPFTSQAFFCAKPIENIKDLSGLKIRTYSAALADFVEGAGGENVTVAFGEVVPALERGVIDCAITGTMPGYSASWHEVTDYLYTLRVGWGIVTLTVNLDSWNRLNDATRSLMEAEIADFNHRAWEGVAALDSQGINCNTGIGECESGEAGEMTLVMPSEADLKARETILSDFVLANWRERCGGDCAEEWNASAGKVSGILVP